LFLNKTVRTSARAYNPLVAERNLDQARQDIDAIDAELVRLLSRRAELAQEIGRLKGADGKPFFTPERERQIYAKLAALNPGPLRESQLVSVFREIISAARAAEKPLSVAYWGPPGTYTQMAALQQFGGSTELAPYDTIHDVFMAVERGHADYGVVPIENSSAGVVPETLDMFPQTNVKICSEVFVPIHHHLVSHAPSLAAVRRVYAGPQPFNQCRRWLREHLPHAEIVEVVPTSRAAESAAKDQEGAAIANRLAADLIGLPILADHVEDLADNRTRFIVVGFNEPAKSGSDKTSLMFTLRNRPGELYRALGAFMEMGVNLMMIESRPAQRSSFEYIFYCDCAGHRSDDRVHRAIEMLTLLALETTVLGSYPTVDDRARV
jgi:chorismate mutase/prephenate dehydratase